MPRQRKPAAIRELEGDLGHKTKAWHAQRATAPTPALVAVDPPEDLPADALKAWEYLTEKLLALRVMSELDGLALEGLVCTYADIRELRRKMADALKDRDEARYMTLVREHRHQHASFRSTLREFGLTPASRAGIETRPPQESVEDELEDLMD